MNDILNITDEPIFDDRIIKIETHTYNPFANTTFEYSDEIRIYSRTATRFVHTAIRKLSVCQGKTDEEQSNPECSRDIGK